MTELKLYNSLTRKKDVFEPIDPSHVRLYACGPTVYSYAHIGNARMAVVFDVLSNLLRGLYPKVTYVSNITDIDDKIIAAAQECGESIEKITEKYARIYNGDMTSLGVRLPDAQPKATDYIPHMIALAEKLIAAGHAYVSEGHVLFHVPSFPAYGGLSGRSRDEQIAGARVEVASYKKDPADFVLWKPSKADEPGWDSPWGRGRPGWHIECSAMAEEILGLPFDIHGGGADLKFPHHENEIAQSCCAHGHTNDLSAFAKYWVHNGFVTVEGEKMSKSLGNFVCVHTIANDYDGGILRLALLSAHYRQPLDWTNQLLHQSEKLWDRINQIFMKHKNADHTPDSKKAYPPILEALYDDLNTPLALSHLNDLVKQVNKATKKDAQQLVKTLHNTIVLLGIQKSDGIVNAAIPISKNTEIESLLQKRAAAKSARDFATADKIRDELLNMGIAIEDTPEGPKWKKTC